MVHNYRDRMGGFSDWVENIVKSRNVRDYRSRVKDTETVSMWQSLSYGICNKSSYCMAACPAGKENIGQYLSDRKGYSDRVIKPLQNRTESVFVLPESDAFDHVTKKYRHIECLALPQNQNQRLSSTDERICQVFSPVDFIRAARTAPCG
jgi:hypothetical protein